MTDATRAPGERELMKGVKLGTCVIQAFKGNFSYNANHAGEVKQKCTLSYSKCRSWCLNPRCSVLNVFIFKWHISKQCAYIGEGI